MLGTHGQSDVLRVASDSVFIAQLFGDRLARRFVTRRWRVARHAFINRLLGGLANIGWRVKVRLTHAKTNHGLPRGLQCGGLCGNGQRGAFLHAADVG